MNGANTRTDRAEPPLMDATMAEGVTITWTLATDDVIKKAFVAVTDMEYVEPMERAYGTMTNFEGSDETEEGNASALGDLRDQKYSKFLVDVEPSQLAVEATEENTSCSNLATETIRGPMMETIGESVLSTITDTESRPQLPIKLHNTTSMVYE
jgi:hypothetical protein